MFHPTSHGTHPVPLPMHILSLLYVRTYNVQARREAHLVRQASQPVGMVRKVATSRVQQQPDVEDICLVAKKTSPQAAVSGAACNCRRRGPV